MATKRIKPTPAPPPSDAHSATALGLVEPHRGEGVAAAQEPGEVENRDQVVAAKGLENRAAKVEKPTGFRHARHDLLQWAAWERQRTNHALVAFERKSSGLNMRPKFNPEDVDCLLPHFSDAFSSALKGGSLSGVGSHHPRSFNH